MEKYIIPIVAAYLIVFNIAGFVSMASDKKKAKKDQRRTPERTLLLIAAAGGSFGSFLGMNLFRHKTKHIKFVICVPLFLILHIFILSFLVWRFLL